MGKQRRKKSSEVQLNNELSSEELLEQIMNKKRAKKKKVSAQKSPLNEESKDKTSIHLETQIKELSSDELYDQIMQRKANRKKKKSVSLEQIASEEKIDNNKKQEDFKDSTEEKQDLIITREIRFDDQFDLNDKKALKELRKAIEEFDRLETAEVTEVSTKEKEKVEEDSTSEFSTRTEKYASLAKKGVSKKEKAKNISYAPFGKKYSYLVFGCICLFVLLVLLLSFSFFSSKDETILKPKDNEEIPLVEEDNLSSLYNDCIQRPLTEEEITAELKEAEESITSYLAKNYKVSIMYEDLSTSFSYSYQPSTVYYAASTIKSLDALYIYTKAAEGSLDLDETMVYSSKYKWSSSKEMSKLSFGTKVTLRDLVKYAITVSDNSAHQMLVSYIGRSNLKEFGNSLGAKNTLVGADNFGNITVSDALIYMKAIYTFIENNASLGEELKSYFVSAEQNDLELPELGIQAAHKYGQYSSYYHDIGIVYDTHPYVVAILTLEGSSNYENKVKDIHSRIYELHTLYYETRENLCKTEVYGN